MQVAIYSRLLKEKDEEIVEEVFRLLEKYQMEVTVFEPYADSLKVQLPTIRFANTYSSHQDLLEQRPEFMITLGGDGTILDTLLIIQDSEIPIVGINIGRLGFLSSIDKNHIQAAIASIVNNNFHIEKRTILNLECNLPIFKNTNFAINDCTISKRDTSSMITIHTYINGNWLNSYWADGLIICTPTGSTGYSLSCGGPIVFPNSGNFVITPIAPHNLNVRPIVISDDAVVTFEIEGRAENFLCTLDSRYETVTAAHKITIRKANFPVNLVRIKANDFSTTIRSKLSWGLDTRN